MSRKTADKLKQIFDAYGTNPTRFANQVGMSGQTLRNWLKFNEFDAHALYKMCKILKVDIRWMLDEEKNNTDEIPDEAWIDGRPPSITERPQV